MDVETNDRVQSINTYHAVGSADDRSKISQYFPAKNHVEIMEFGDYFWNHPKKCIQISTNLPSIGEVSYEIEFHTVKN